MRKNVKIIVFFLLFFNTLNAEINILSYNVENLFDIEKDSIKSDGEFTPEGKRHWSYGKYQKKVSRIAQVITSAGKWEGFDMIGLMEIENRRCLNDLCKQLQGKYKILHYESEDKRGIDVAVLYGQRAKIIENFPIKINLPNNSKTRDLLYVKAAIGGDTIFLIACHLPSQLGGAKETELKRQIVKQTIQTQIDSILNRDENAKIIVMGDMNCDPSNDLDKMTNITFEPKGEIRGTYKYQDEWSFLDQAYCSKALLEIVSYQIFIADWLVELDEKYMGVKPKRTFIGFKYNDGYSDHLPLMIKIGKSTL